MSEADSFVAKWLMREPEMEIALVFSSPQERPACRLWGALSNELEEATSELSDPAISQTKMAWWSDELARALRGEARHPLTRELMALPTVRGVTPSAWARLTQAALQLAVDERRPEDVPAALRQREAVARASAAVEAELFGVSAEPVALAISALVRGMRRALSTPGEETRMRWPLNLVARHQLARVDVSDPGLRAASQALMVDLSTELASALQAASGGSTARRCRRAFDLRMLASWSRGQVQTIALPPLASLWLGWRAARTPAADGR